MNHNCYLRNGKEEDVDILFEWANDADVRRNSFSTADIVYENHVKWYESLLQKENVKQYILVSDGECIGQVRVSVEGEKAEIGYSLSAKHRGKGYGKQIISLLPSKIKEDFPAVRVLVAQVKTDNLASQKVFLDNSYETKCIVYEYTIPE